MNKRHLLIGFLTGFLVLILVTAAVGYRALFTDAVSSPASTASTKFEIVAGSSFSRVANELEEEGLVPSTFWFSLLARLRGVENNIRTGEYELEPGITASQILDKIVSGESVQYRITLVEGWTFQQALDAIWASENIDKSLEGLSVSEIAMRMNLVQENPEGLLYPDTYFYTKGTRDLELLLRANGRLETLLADAWEARLGALPYADSYEALTMASIIEKESARTSERELIASVFVSRLDRGMRLQSDPTTIYGMGERYAGNIRREDLLEETPYNTYRIDGLPPTPIGLSGSASISAALNPAASDYLYFVARGDGSHQFSRTLEEHNAAVREYQLGTSN